MDGKVRISNLQRNLSMNFEKANSLVGKRARAGGEFERAGGEFPHQSTC